MRVEDIHAPDAWPWPVPLRSRAHHSAIRLLSSWRNRTGGRHEARGTMYEARVGMIDPTDRSEAHSYLVPRTSRRTDPSVECANMSEFSVYEILNRKRRGAPLEAREIETFIDRYTRGEVPDYQMSAPLMATAINGMTA